MSEFRLPFDATSEEFQQRLRVFAQGSGKLPHCDKCDGLVPPQNNAAVFEFINTFGHVAIYVAVNRHIQPVVGKHNEVTCEGSPSRWRAISGLPDPRPEYQSVQENDPVAIQIWNFMQTFGTPEIESP